jgi:hypothetical protein
MPRKAVVASRKHLAGRCAAITDYRRHEITLGTILLIVLVLILVGVIPIWPHSRGWGYGPSGGLGLVLLILLVLFLLGKI